MNVVCVGDCGIDRYLPTGDDLIGGITANFARHSRTQFPASDRITVISVLGDDDEAARVSSSFKDLDIDCRFTRLPGTTPVQYIIVEPDGEKNFVRYDEGVLGDFRFDEADRQIISGSDLLVAPVYLQIVGLFDDLMAIEKGGLVSIDFADFIQHPDFDLLERYIDAIDIAFFGLSIDDQETIERVAAIARQYEKLFVVTLGAAGSRAYHGDQRIDCAAVPVERVTDTTGAGDAYAAAFLSRYCHGVSVAASMAAGAELASAIVQRPGAV